MQQQQQFPRQMPAPCAGCGLTWPTPTQFCPACGTKIDYVWVCDITQADAWEPWESDQLAS